MAQAIDVDLWQWWRELIARHPKSGMTVAKFCDSNGISKTTFYQWRRKLQQTAPTSPNGFLRVDIVQQSECPASDVVRVRFPIKFEFATPEQVESACGGILQACDEND